MGPGHYTLELDAGGDANERELWHGTGALDDVLAHDFNTAYASLENNVYSVGIFLFHLPGPGFIICKRQVFTSLLTQGCRTSSSAQLVAPQVRKR